jgi:hypothetical protein
VKRGIAVLAAVLGVAGMVGLAGWGCVATTSEAELANQKVVDYEPDGGWANYKPGPSYEPKPMESAAGGVLSPRVDPATPVSPVINPTVGR